MDSFPGGYVLLLIFSLRYNYYQPWKLRICSLKIAGLEDEMSLEQKKCSLCWFLRGYSISCNNSMWSLSQADRRPHFHQTGPHFLKSMKIQVFLDGFDLSGWNWRPHIYPHWYLSVLSKKTGGIFLFWDAKLDQIWTMDPWCWKTYPNWMNLRNSCDRFAPQLGWVLPIIRRKTHHSCLGSTA